jgi:hypothetical protein
MLVAIPQQILKVKIFVPRDFVGIGALSLN